MKTILKVVRCNQHGFRLGIFLPADKIDTENAEFLVIKGLTQSDIIPRIQEYRKYKSLIASEIGHFINSKNLTHEAGENLHLLKFELVIDNKKHTYTYKGACTSMKLPHRNVCMSKDGIPMNVNDVETMKALFEEH